MGVVHRWSSRGLLRVSISSVVFLTALLLSLQTAQAAGKPNILVMFGDDIGQANISRYTHGLVGYTTPNIDRVGEGGITFTDYYAENSCTAGRSTFIAGQAAYRTGLSKVGLPGAAQGLMPRDITIAQAIKPLGYATGQFGKNHLGDKDEYLPTNHGFDEFYENLYHLNAEEEPERPIYQSLIKQDPGFQKIYSPRGVIHSYADGKIEDSGDGQANGDYGRGFRECVRDLHQEASLGKYTVLRLDEFHTYAPVHTRDRCGTRPERHAGQRVCRWHDSA